MPKQIITAPCENCHYKNGTECLNVLALLRTAHAMDVELYSHNVEKLVPEFVIPCKHYVPVEAEEHQTIQGIV